MLSWSIIRFVIEFELLNSTQIEFQCWVELREINSTQSSWVRLSTQLSQLDELTRTQLQIYFLSNSLSNFLSKWSNFLSNSLSNSLSCSLSYFSSIFLSNSLSNWLQNWLQKKKFEKKRKSILFLVHSILYLVTKIKFKQLNLILSWARVEKNQLNFNLNSELSWVDFSQLNSTLTWW